MHNLKKTYNL